MDLLLSNGANPNFPTTHEISPLVQAVLKRNLAAIETLLQAGADCNTISSNFEQHPQRPSHYSNYSYVDSLLGFGGHQMFILWASFNALQAACAQGDLQIVGYLLENGAKLNLPAAEKHGMTAL